MKKKVLVLDNYDSFTFNLVQLLDESGLCDYKVKKNDSIGLEDIEPFDKILFSPGPGIPSDVKIMAEIVREFHQTKSILGICLGHQCIAEVFGGTLFHLQEVLHGIKSEVRILESEDNLFKDIPAEINAGLYHSWAVDRGTLPDCLKISAISKSDIIMGISHRRYDVKGVQFHPESFMTEYGCRIIMNWLER